MDIHGKSLDMDMDGKFYMYGKHGNHRNRPMFCGIIQKIKAARFLKTVKNFLGK